MMEYMGAPESARLLGRSPEYWLEHMGRDRAVAAALRLHHDASLIMTNVQVMAQFVTSLNRTASEVIHMVYDKAPFPTDAVQFVTPGRRVMVMDNRTTTGQGLDGHETYSPHMDGEGS